MLPYSFRAGSSNADVLPRGGLTSFEVPGYEMRSCRGGCTRRLLGTTPVSRETLPRPDATKGDLGGSAATSMIGPRTHRRKLAAVLFGISDSRRL